MRTPTKATLGIVSLAILAGSYQAAQANVGATSTVAAGATDPTVAAPGTIRGDLGRDWGLKVQQNLVHGSDSPESAARELALWF